MNILSVENASFTVGHVALLDKTSFQLDSGEKIGLIGRNGAGKSSFLKILAGVQKLDDGQIIVQNNLKIVYVPQESFFDKEATVFDTVAEGLGENPRFCCAVTTASAMIWNTIQTTFY